QKAFRLGNGNKGGKVGVGQEGLMRVLVLETRQGENFEIAQQRNVRVVGHVHGCQKEIRDLGASDDSRVQAALEKVMRIAAVRVEPDRDAPNLDVTRIKDRLFNGTKVNKWHIDRS